METIYKGIKVSIEKFNGEIIAKHVWIDYVTPNGKKEYVKIIQSENDYPKLYLNGLYMYEIMTNKDILSMSDNDLCQIGVI
jgi:hypothetical protein